VIQFLNQNLNQAPITFLLATSVPEKKFPDRYANNAFPNSFHYDNATRTIFVRVERTRDVGTFTLILIHVVSHIQAGEWSDIHPKFIETFYTSLRYICAELFFARTKKQDKVDENDEDFDGMEPTLDIKELREAFGACQKMEGKEDIIHDFINLTQVGTVHDKLFAEDRLLRRLDQYKEFSHSTALRNQLEQLEKSVASREYLKDKLAKSEIGMDEHEGLDDDDLYDLGLKKPEEDFVRRNLKETIRVLQYQSDMLHSKLLSTVKEIQVLSERIIKIEESNGSNKGGYQQWSEQLTKTRAKLKRLNTTKTALTERIDELEERTAIKSKQLMEQ